MFGYMLAGTDEAPSPITEINGSRYKPYRGMANRSAMERRYTVEKFKSSGKKYN